MSAPGDAEALLALLSESTARVESSTEAHALLVQQHAAEAASFSSRAAKEIARLVAEQQKLSDVKDLRAAVIDSAEQESATILATAAAYKRQMEADIAEKEARLADLETTERAVQARAQALAGAGGFVELMVGCQLFSVSSTNLARYPQSTLAEQCKTGCKSRANNPR